LHLAIPGAQVSYGNSHTWRFPALHRARLSGAAYGEILWIAHDEPARQVAPGKRAGLAHVGDT
jgi:hypothetical protein